MAALDPVDFNHYEPNSSAIVVTRVNPIAASVTDGAWLPVIYLAAADNRYTSTGVPRYAASLTALRAKFYTGLTLPSPVPTYTPTSEDSSQPSPSAERPDDQVTNGQVPQTSALSSTSTSLQTSAPSRFSTSNHSDKTHPSATPVTPNPKSKTTIPTGSVAGITIGAALGLALLTFLLTYLCMRRRRKADEETRQVGHGPMDKGSSAALNGRSEKKQPLATVHSLASSIAIDESLQAADDSTVSSKVKTVLDHLELYVENFYQGTPHSGRPETDSGLSSLQPPHLKHGLSSLLATSRDPTIIIKSVLAHYVLSRTCVSGPYKTGFLPDEYALAPSSMVLRDGTATKTSHIRFLSQWRILTTLLCPEASSNAQYIATREARVRKAAQQFLRAFEPWARGSFTTEDRASSLHAIMQEAADLGVFLFRQPPDLAFEWPEQDTLGAGRLATTPRLVKRTDERGNMLPKYQELVEASIQRL